MKTQSWKCGGKILQNRNVSYPQRNKNICNVRKNMKIKQPNMNKKQKRSQLGFWKLKLDTKIKFKIHKLSTWYNRSQN